MIHTIVIIVIIRLFSLSLNDVSVSKNVMPVTGKVLRGWNWNIFLSFNEIKWRSNLKDFLNVLKIQLERLQDLQVTTYFRQTKSNLNPIAFKRCQMVLAWKIERLTTEGSALTLVTHYNTQVLALDLLILTIVETFHCIL